MFPHDVVPEMAPALQAAGWSRPIGSRTPYGTWTNAHLCWADLVDRRIHSSHKLALKGESMRKLKAGAQQPGEVVSQVPLTTLALPVSLAAGQFAWRRWSVSPASVVNCLAVCNQ